MASARVKWRGAAGASASSTSASSSSSARSAPALLRQPRFRLDSGSEASIVVLSGANPFSCLVDADARVEMDGDVARGNGGGGALRAWSWNDDDGDGGDGGDGGGDAGDGNSDFLSVKQEDDGSFAAGGSAGSGSAAGSSGATRVVLSPLSGRWSVVTGATASTPSMARVKKIAASKAPHGDLLAHYASAQMSSDALLVQWDDCVDAQLAVIALLLSDARPQETVVVIAPALAVDVWASRIERAALLARGAAGGGDAPSQRVITVLICTPHAYVERFSSFSRASLLVVDRPPHGLEREHLPASSHCIVLQPPYRLAPTWSLLGRVCVFDARAHAALAAQFPAVRVFRADVDSSTASASSTVSVTSTLTSSSSPIAQTLLTNLLTVGRWPQVVVLHPLDGARRDALVALLSSTEVTKLVKDSESQQLVERTQPARVDVIDGSVSRSARDEVLRDVGRGAIDILLISIAAWVNALYAGDAWQLKGVRALHFLDADAWSDVEAWGACVDASSFAKSYAKVAPEPATVVSSSSVEGQQETVDAPASLLALDYVGDSEVQQSAYARVLEARESVSQTLAALCARSIPMPLTQKWKARAASSASSASLSASSSSSAAASSASAASSGAGAAYWTPRRLQTALPFPGGGGWKTWSDGWPLLLYASQPLLQQAEIGKTAARALSKAALEQLSVELASQQAAAGPAALDADGAVARLVEITLDLVARELGAQG